MTKSPASPSTAWSEHSDPDEDERFREFAQFIIKKQETVAEGKRRLRGFHAKLHAGLMAEFKVLPDLPAPARFGVFVEPRIFPAVVRFSNGESLEQADKKKEPRGLAIKLVGVPGRKLLPGGEDAVTQDFLGTSHSVTSTVRNAGQFFSFIRAKEQKSRIKGLALLVRELGLSELVRISWALFKTVGLSKVRSMATEEYSGTVPIRMGPYAVKFTVKPPETSPPDPGHPDVDDPHFLHQDLVHRLRQGDLHFDFFVQFFVDEKRTPIEDTSVEWKRCNAPLVPVAELRIFKCDLKDQDIESLSQTVNRLSFNPWHALEDHRPLGNVMRARRVAYEASATFRGHLPEPTSLPL